MIIPERKIEEIRSSTNIVDIISETVQLRKRGKNYIGLCPFHQEKTPSFTVSEEKQIFHCFGCHAGGNVYKFLMDIENISFVEAVQYLANKLGIVLDYDENVSSEKQSEQEILYDINTLAAKFFSNNLLKNISGETGSKYFDNRKIKIQTQRIFGLGYALPEWESFVNFAKSERIDLEKASLLGLIEKKDTGGFYDKFRGRIIFPIFSPNGRVIAFGGRILEKVDNAAKYLNSPESSIYLKRRSLYGLYHSKDEIRKLDKALLVEGYLDMISLYQAGIKNVVASSGTALTEDQVHLLSRYTKNIVVFYDADPAGIKASLRSIEILVKQNFDVRIAELPEGDDPDSFIIKNGREEFEEIIKRAPNFLEYQSLQLEKKGMFNDPELQTKAIRDLVQSASFVKDELKRTILLKSISKKFNLREKLLESEMEKFLQGLEKPAVPLKERIQTNGNDKKEGTASEIHNLTAPSEKEIIKLLFEGDEKVIRYIFEHLTPESFSNEKFQQLAELVYEEYSSQGNISPAVLIEKIEDEKIKTAIMKSAFDKYTISKTWEEYSSGLDTETNLLKYAKDTVKKYRLFQIDKELKMIDQRIDAASDENERKELLSKIKQIWIDKSNIEKE